MKKIFLFALLVCGALAVQAQTKGHDCASHKAKASATAVESVSDDVIAQAASLDENIERRVCENSGKVSYYRKSTCEKSGKVSYNPVNYDSASSTFVNVSPAQVTKKKACASKANGKSCCAKGAKATAVAGKAGKSCCAGKKGAKACSSKKGARATSVSNETMSAEDGTR